MIVLSIRRSVGLLLPALLCLTVACADRPDGVERTRPGQEAGAGDETAVVAVSVLPLAGIVDRLLPADALEIAVLVPPGASPHAFEPGFEQLRELSAARLVLLVGHPALTWERTWLADALGGDSDRIAALAADCPSVPDDPHVWLDPGCLRRMADVAAAALAEAMPGRRAEIETARDGLFAATDSAERRASEILASEGAGTFLVVHPAWGYFARAFGMEQVSILSHGSGDSGAARLAAVIERARREGIRTVVVQPQYSAEAARVVAGEIGGTLSTLDPLERDPVDMLVETARVLGAASVP
jgi:zinc transport system substrate-binding protein